MEYKDKCRIMEDRLNEVNELSHESQAQLGDSTEVLRGLEAKLRLSEVSFQLKWNFHAVSSVTVFRVYQTPRQTKKHVC